MAWGVRLRCWGEWACFTRPEMKVERVSYDAMTPSAARGVLEAVYWKPEIRWTVNRITVLRPIRFSALRRNEVSERISADTARSAMRAGAGSLALIATEARQQRAALLLCDVDYIIDAHFTVVSGPDNPAKHMDQFQRRARRGACWTRPYLGCREFAAHFCLVEADEPAPAPHPSLDGEHDLGWMLHDIDFAGGCEARFFRARIEDGVITVPPFAEARMILQRLAELYDCLVAAGEAKLPPPGYSLQKVSFCIVLKADGALHGFEDMRSQDGKQMRPKVMTVPGQGKPSGSGLTPCFLWDSPEYLLGISLDPAKAERAPKAFAAFREEHLHLAAKLDHPAFAAVCAFLRAWTPEAAAPHQAALQEYATNFGVFRLMGEQKFVHELVARPEEVGANAGALAMCLVSGEQALPARLHEPKIKGVAGAQTAGALLVSFNAPAFTSYGKDQSFNAPVSRAVVFKYANALNHLVADRKRRIGLGDATVVYWADRDSREGRATLGAMDALLGAFADEEEAEAPPAEDRERLTEVRLLLGHLRDGTAHAASPPDGIPTRFFLLGLSPNASRLSVRLWVDADASTLTRRLSEHVGDLQLAGSRDDRPLSIWRIVTASGRCDANTGKFDAKTVSPQLAGELARSVLTGAPYPRSLLAAMVRRIRADRGIAHARVSAIKAVLARLARLRGRPQEVPVQLDPSLPDPAYRCGQLFALLEKAQTDALGDLNATIKDRYFASASATPALVFPRLFRLHQNHLAKLEPGGKVFYGRLMGEAMRAPFTFPPRLTLEEQGLFIVGYYQQQRSLYTKRDRPAPEEPAHA